MRLFRQAFLLFIVMTLFLGLVYPLLLTGISQLVFANKSNGSLIYEENTVRGSELIAQKFSRPEYFWPRPSASDFSAMPSGASNQGPTSRKLRDDVKKRRQELSVSHNADPATIPEDLLQASGSGLDPHISPKAAQFQIHRVSKARGLSEVQEHTLKQMIEQSTEPRQLATFGEKRVNVLRLNHALDKTFGKMTK